MNYLRRVVISILLAMGIGLFGVGAASAERYTSPSYTIDASVGNSFGGDQSSTSYKLTSSGGESIVGGGAGGSYILGAGYVAQLDKSLQVTVQPAGQMAYHPLDETSATSAYDASTYSSISTSTGGPSVTSGKIAGAWSFDGVDDRVTVANNASLNTITSITWSAWIYPTNVAKDQMIVSKQGENYLRINGGYAFASAKDGVAQRTVTGTTPLANNQWYHIAMTFGGNSMKLYVNGNEEASLAVGNSFGFNTGSYQIGQWTDADRRSFVGKIDEVKIFSRAFTAYEIKAEYDAGAAGNAAGLAFSGDIIPGTSRTTVAQATVQTDAPGYTLMLNQNQDLTSGGSTIAPVTNSGTIGTPATWTESTTKGLGFTLTSTTATALPGKWGTNPNYAYAALPGSSTSFYTRTGYTSGGKDTIGIQYRVDVPGNQSAGSYTNVVTYTGVMTP